MITFDNNYHMDDEVYDAQQSQTMLEYLEGHNMFIVPLDDERHWYRYHHLFADLLRSQLGRLYPDQVPELHRRASLWYEQHGLIEKATMILVVGTTGYLGGIIARQLLVQGWEVRILVRASSNYQSLMEAGAALTWPLRDNIP